MKELFYNSSGDNTAVITCKNKQGVFEIYYHLYDNPVQHIWQGIHKSCKEIVMGGTSSVSVEDLLKELNHYCALEGLPSLPTNVTQEQLNNLHHQYVLSNRSNNWHKINLLIHVLESKLIHSPLREYDSCLHFYTKEEQYIPLKKEYKVLLNSDIIWGKLQLGYATLGKDWIDIQESDDDDNLKDLAIQKHISSETLLLFCPEQMHYSAKVHKFYKWAKTFKQPVPLNDLNELSFGRYPLGQVIITDVFLDFHSVASDWYVPNHVCKLKWNRDFFTSDTVVLGVEFKNTDLMYETLLSHTNFGELGV